MKKKRKKRASPEPTCGLKNKMNEEKCAPYPQAGQVLVQSDLSEQTL
jgi:hypothetical protein